MGQCGCADFTDGYKLKGPDGIWYFICVYLPCRYCDTPGGVVIYRLKEEFAKDCGFLDDTRDFPINTYSKGKGETDGETLIPIVHPKSLAKKLTKFLHGMRNEKDFPYFDKVMAEIIAEDFAEQGVLESIEATLKEHQKDFMGG